MLWCMFAVFQCCFVLYVLCVYCAHFHSLHERPSCQNGILFTHLASFSLRVWPDFKWVLPVADILMLWCIYVVLQRQKKQHLTIIVYVSYFLCVYCAQCDVLSDFCMKWFCCCMKTKTIVPNMFGVCVNFKIRTFQWSAVQLCGEMALGKGGGERRLL